MKALSYQDVLLVPEYYDGGSRKEASTEVDFLGHKFELPVIPANMEDVISLKVARELYVNGMFYIYHRFEDTLDFIETANAERWSLVSISVGVNDDSKEIIHSAKDKNLRIDFITIDVAHGHQRKVAEMIPFIKGLYPDVKVIAGNIATYEGYKFLVEAGADAVKVGIGQGSICTTKLETGFSVPMFSCLLDLRDNLKTVPIIADGGIQTRGDIAKALAAGATMVMSGKLFAECVDSPAKKNEWGHTIYRGSTSFEAKTKKQNIEGKTIYIDTGKNTVEEQCQKIKESLQSSITYAGGKTLDCLRKVKYIEIK